jgi:hypothetical protein
MVAQSTSEIDQIYERLPIHHEVISVCPNPVFDTETGIGSGVELDKPPFNRRLTELCRVKVGNERIVTWRVRGNA